MLGNCETHVKTDKIGRAKRADGMLVSQGHCRINVFDRGNPFFKHADGLEGNHDAKPAARKTRGIAHRNDVLSETPNPILRPSHHVRVRTATYDNLYKAARRNRIEEVQSHELSWSRESVSQAINRERTCVRTDHCAGGGFGDQGKNLLLELYLFWNSLHN